MYVCTCRLLYIVQYEHKYCSLHILNLTRPTLAFRACMRRCFWTLAVSFSAGDASITPATSRARSSACKSSTFLSRTVHCFHIVCLHTPLLPCLMQLVREVRAGIDLGPAWAHCAPMAPPPHQPVQMVGPLATFTLYAADYSFVIHFIVYSLFPQSFLHLHRLELLQFNNIWLLGKSSIFK